MGSYCACSLSWPLPELSIRGTGQKDENAFACIFFCKIMAGTQTRRAFDRCVTKDKQSHLSSASGCQC